MLRRFPQMSYPCWDGVIELGLEYSADEATLKRTSHNTVKYSIVDSCALTIACRRWRVPVTAPWNSTGAATSTFITGSRIPHCPKAKTEIKVKIIMAKIKLDHSAFVIHSCIPFCSVSRACVSILLCCHVTVTVCSIHQDEQNCEISMLNRHAMMTLWQAYTNTRWQHVTACWDLMYQLVPFWSSPNSTKNHM